MGRTSWSAPEWVFRVIDLFRETDTAKDEFQPRSEWVTEACLARAEAERDGTWEPPAVDPEEWPEVAEVVADA